MASWRSYFGGRYSPFGGAAPSAPPPRVTEDDYHYLGPEDIVDPPPARGGPAHHHHGGGANDDDDASQPDVLIMRHRGTTYPLHFPAYSIGEGLLRVGELRRYAADKTGASDPRRVKLLYKGHVLKDDAVACCEEGLKQNSELTCVVSEGPARRRANDDDDSDSASEDDFARGARDRRRAESLADPGVRVSVDGTLLDPTPRPARRRHPDQPDHARRPSEHRRYDPESQKPAATATTTASAPAPASTPAPAPAPSPSPSPRPPAAGAPPAQPKTPHDKLQVIADQLRNNWTPLVQKYAANPPRDPKANQQEYMRLSESIMNHIMLKLDDITTDGDQDLRNRRKATIVETQKVLAELDAVGRAKADR